MGGRTKPELNPPPVPRIQAKAQDPESGTNGDDTPWNERLNFGFDTVQIGTSKRDTPSRRATGQTAQGPTRPWLRTPWLLFLSRVNSTIMLVSSLPPSSCSRSGCPR